MKLLLFKLTICCSLFINCFQKTNEVSINKKTITTSKVLLNKKKDTLFKNKIETPKKVENLGELNMQKDTVYIVGRNNVFFIDTPKEKGFLRTYYCGSNKLNFLLVKEKKIVDGLFLDGIVENNKIDNSYFTLSTYETGIKEGVYLEIDRQPNDFCFYKKGVKSGYSLFRYTNGRAGIVCKEIYKNGKMIKKNCDYYDWSKEASNFLKKKEAKSIRNFIFCLYGEDFYDH